MHVRAQVRAQAVAQLRDRTGAERRIYVGRVHAVTEADLPAIYVEIGDEVSAPVHVRGGDLGREIDLIIGIRASAQPDEIGNVLDELQAEVEAAMASDVTLGATAVTSYPIRTRPSYTPGERVLGAQEITYLVRTGTRRADPSIII
jgi:hypothetical protein